MSDKQLNPVWVKAMELIKTLTGDVDTSKGTLQEQCNEMDNMPHSTPIGEGADIEAPAYDAKDVSYDNTESGLESTNIQDVIGELASKPSGIREITKAEYDVLADKSGSYIVTDEDFIGDAKDVAYEDENSLGANNVQDAIDKMAGTYSNPNLLDNPWFTVNQRGATSVTGTAREYVVDRWTCGGQHTFTKGEGITLQASSANWAIFNQRVENELRNSLWGKTVTYSVMFSDGNIVSATGKMPNGEVSEDVSICVLRYTNAFASAIYIYPSSKGNMTVQIGVTAGNSVSIKAIKLELGSVSTLANDVAPNYQQELAKCQRYCLVLRDNHASGQTFTSFFDGRVKMGTETDFKLPISMRTSPSVTVSSVNDLSVRQFSTDGKGTIVSAKVTAVGRFVTRPLDGSNIDVYCATEDKGFQPNTMASLGITNGGYIMFSADL